jgi:hypothetical protein
MQQVRTIRLSGSKPGGEEHEDHTSGGSCVTVIAPGRGSEVEAGRSVRETLAEAGIFPTPQQLVRVGREEVRNLEHVLQPGDVVTVVNKVRAG